MKTLTQTYQAKQTEAFPLSAVRAALLLPKKQRDQLRARLVATRADLLTRQETLRAEVKRTVPKS